jgi:hypothetical protein
MSCVGMGTGEESPTSANQQVAKRGDLDLGVSAKFANGWENIGKAEPLSGRQLPSLCTFHKCSYNSALSGHFLKPSASIISVAPLLYSLPLQLSPPFSSTCLLH